MPIDPNDIDPASGSRFPLPRREELDELGQRMYDQIVDPKANLIRGLKGPSGIYLHSPRISELLRPVNAYLRNQAGFSGRVRELAILAAARACDSQFEWVAHEKEALKEGVPQAAVDAIKNNSSTAALDPADAVVIELARGAFMTRRVSADVYARALKLFGRQKLVELTVLMGYYVMTAGMLTVVDQQLDAGQAPSLPVPAPPVRP